MLHKKLQTQINFFSAIFLFLSFVTTGPDSSDPDRPIRTRANPARRGAYRAPLF